MGLQQALKRDGDILSLESSHVCRPAIRVHPP
jgi:hypothetical protein